MALLVTAAWNAYKLKIEILIFFGSKGSFFPPGNVHLHFCCVCQEAGKVCSSWNYNLTCGKPYCVCGFFYHCGYVNIDEANGLVRELIICQFVHLLNKSLFRGNTVFPCAAFFLTVGTASCKQDFRRM